MFRNEEGTDGLKLMAERIYIAYR